MCGIDGMDALLSAATGVIAGAGLKDIEFCEIVSDLIGQHEVDKRSHSSSNTESSRSTSTHCEPTAAPRGSGGAQRSICGTNSWPLWAQDRSR